LFLLVDFPAGTEIFAAGDPARRLYFVCAGEVTIRYRPYDGDALDIAHIPPGGAFGWSAALRRATYTASAVAKTAVQAMAIEARDLHRIMAKDADLSAKMLEHAAQLAGSRLDSLGRQVIGLLKP
jgi:CRP-like cAMP-binding protein